MNQLKTGDFFPRLRYGVEGWFALTDAEIFCALLNQQVQLGWAGSVVEIGTHHGKSFVPLGLSNNGERAYIIDIFDNQELNIDNSGAGDRAQFLKTMAAFGVPHENLKVDARLSNDVSSYDILNSVGEARFFHIDGGHHLDAIRNDLRLAVSSSARHAIIAVDDLFRPEWPEVSIGVFGERTLENAGFKLFAYGFNKAYWCNKDYLEIYQDALSATPFLKMAFSKSYPAKDGKILIFSKTARPDWRLRHKLRWYLETFHPGQAFRMFKLLKRR